MFLLVILLFSCKKESQETFGKTQNSNIESKTPELLGQELFEGKGNCVACHQVAQKTVGPSIQDIAKTYKDQNGSIVNFLKNDAKPIVDPSQYEVMKVNFAITKAMSDDELNALEVYINSKSK